MREFKCIKSIGDFFTKDRIYKECDNSLGVLSLRDNKNLPHVVIPDNNAKNWFYDHFIVPTAEDYIINKLEIDTVNNKYVFYGEDAEVVSNAINDVSNGFLTRAVTLSDGTIRTFNINYIVSIRYNYYGA